MRLELHVVKIRDIRFGDTTEIRDGALSIHLAELKTLLEKDRRFARVDVELARPGEKCRILRVADVMEPRAKLDTGGEDALAFAEKHSTGQGRTCALKGAAVALIDLRHKGDGSGTAPRDDIIDMSGLATRYSDYGGLCIIAILPRPKEGVGGSDYLAALKLAGLKASAYLARAGENVPADETEAYDLPSLTAVARGLEDLPKDRLHLSDSQPPVRTYSRRAYPVQLAGWRDHAHHSPPQPSVGRRRHVCASRA